MSTATVNLPTNLEQLKATHAQIMAALEAGIKAKYGPGTKYGLNIIGGSLRHEPTAALGGGVHANKRTVLVVCPHCPNIVRRATSDLFTFKGCPACLKVVRKTNKGAAGTILALQAKIQALLDLQVQQGASNIVGPNTEPNTETVIGPVVAADLPEPETEAEQTGIETIESQVDAEAELAAESE